MNNAEQPQPARETRRAASVFFFGFCNELPVIDDGFANVGRVRRQGEQRRSSADRLLRGLRPGASGRRGECVSLQVQFARIPTRTEVWRAGARYARERRRCRQFDRGLFPTRSPEPPARWAAPGQARSPSECWRQALPMAARKIQIPHMIAKFLTDCGCSRLRVSLSGVCPNLPAVSSATMPMLASISSNLTARGSPYASTSSQNQFAPDSPLEEMGFEPSVPLPRLSSIRAVGAEINRAKYGCLSARPRVRCHCPPGKTQHLLPKSVFDRPGSDRWNLASTTFPDAGPMVRIRFPLAQSLRTTGSSARARRSRAPALTSDCRAVA